MNAARRDKMKTIFDITKAVREAAHYDATSRRGSHLGEVMLTREIQRLKPRTRGFIAHIYLMEYHRRLV